MDRYFEFLDSVVGANELNAPAYLVEEFGIEYRIAVEITTEWIRRNWSRRDYADRHDREV